MGRSHAMQFDVAIVGGGIAGAALAFRLAPARSVLLIEREIGLGAHATGRSAAEWSIVHADGLARPLTALSADFLRAPPPGLSEAALWRIRGNVIYARRGDEDALAAFAKRATGCAAITPAVARGYAPFLDPSVISECIYDAANAEIDVDALLSAYARGARGAGARIMTGAILHAIERRAGAWSIMAGEERLVAAVLVNAAGAWADDVAALCGRAPLGLEPRRRTAAIVAPPPGVDARGAASIDDVATGFYLKPEAGLLMACPADQTPSPPCDAQPEDIDVAMAAAMAEEIMGIPTRKIHARWAGLRTFTPDGDPAVGWDGDDFFWLAGVGGYGIMTSPALSLAAAEIFNTGDTLAGMRARGITAQAMSPARFSGD